LEFFTDWADSALTAANTSPILGAGAVRPRAGGSTRDCNPHFGFHFFFFFPFFYYRGSDGSGLYTWALNSREPQIHAVVE